MSKSSSNVETTRVQTSLGVFIVVSHDTGVRAGQVFSQGGQWYAHCVDWYSPGIPPISCRVPERGGCSSPDELEELIVQEVAAQMKTDYWSDR